MILTADVVTCLEDGFDLWVHLDLGVVLLGHLLVTSLNLLVYPRLKFPADNGEYDVGTVLPNGYDGSPRCVARLSAYSVVLKCL